MNKFYSYRKMQEATGTAEQGGGHPAPQAQPTAQGGAFANLMSRLGFGSNQQPTEPQQPTAQPATNSQQQAPQQAAPLPSEFFGKLFTPQPPAQDSNKDKTPATNPAFLRFLFLFVFIFLPALSFALSFLSVHFG